MSFALPPIKVKPAPLEEVSAPISSYGVPSTMYTGLANTKQFVGVHPLIPSERNHFKNKQDMDMAILRNTQGLHAPLRIGMELKSANKIGRLPFLQSSNVMLDVLTGRDLEIVPEDVYNLAEFKEVAGQPHAMVEKSLGIL